MRVRAFASFIPVAALLAVCAVTSRAPGRTLNAILGGYPVPMFDCSTREVIYLEATGYAWPLMNATCRIYDASGTTVSKSCDGATHHQVKLWTTIVPGTNGSSQLQGTSEITPWAQYSATAKTISVFDPTTGRCSPIYFTPYAWGTD
jgi:hypothetical protein